MKYPTLSIATVILAGCASVADVDVQPPTTSISVPSGSEVCVIYPKDGKFEGAVQRNSGDKVGDVILKSIPTSYNAERSLSVENCTSNYLVTSEILEYENRLSGWSGKPDKIRIKVAAMDRVNNVTSILSYYADTNMAASFFFEWGNAAPYQLLDSEFTRQVEALFQK
jgi:hypothetical protein